MSTNIHIKGSLSATNVSALGEAQKCLYQSFCYYLKQVFTLKISNKIVSNMCVIYISLFIKKKKKNLSNSNIYKF